MAYFISICIVTCILSRTLAEKSPFWEYKLCNWSEIVPDVLDEVPENLELCKVVYPSGAEVNLGNYLTRTQAYDPPTVSWTSDPSAYYVVILEDADSPSRAMATMRENFHWMVGNIPGNNVSAGETIFPHIFPTGSFSSGIHRYIIFVYKQAEKTNYIQEIMKAGGERGPFEVTSLQRRYGWKGPVALNFFYYRRT